MRPLPQSFPSNWMLRNTEDMYQLYYVYVLPRAVPTTEPLVALQLH